MPSRHEPRSSGETTSPVWQPKPFEVAALATAMSICRNMEKPSRLDGTARRIEPKDCIRDAYELLSEAGNFLAHELADDALNRAESERRLAAGVYDPAKEYSWKEVLKPQQKKIEDQGSVTKFSPDKKWPRFRSKFESGTFYFTDHDLTNRPLGLSMVDTITTDKGLRKAVKRLFAEEASEIIKDQALSLWRINLILVDQLGRNHGKIIKPRAKSTTS